jgi:hypothetical protein
VANTNTASSPTVERAFSTARNFQGQHRPSLLPSTIHAACLQKAWWRSDVLGFIALLSITLDPDDSVDVEMTDGIDNGPSHDSVVNPVLNVARYWDDSVENGRCGEINLSNTLFQALSVHNPWISNEHAQTT